MDAAFGIDAADARLGARIDGRSRAQAAFDGVADAARFAGARETLHRVGADGVGAARARVRQTFVDFCK